MRPPRFKGVELERVSDDYYAAPVRGGTVRLELVNGAWHGSVLLHYGGGAALRIGADVGSSSQTSALRSLTGHLKNAQRVLNRLLEPARGKGAPRG